MVRSKWQQISKKMFTSFNASYTYIYGSNPSDNCNRMIHLLFIFIQQNDERVKLKPSHTVFVQCEFALTCCSGRQPLLLEITLPHWTTEVSLGVRCLMFYWFQGRVFLYIAQNSLNIFFWNVKSSVWIATRRIHFSSIVDRFFEST